MRLPRMKYLVWTLLVLALTPPAALLAQAKDMENPFARRQKVPPLPQNLTWLNTAGPLELHDLRGKFVLMDFWTYCCINCMHILPELHKLEQAWPKNLVVIGVHSAKFTSEQDTQNIRAAIQRYKIEHPVINDARHELWESFGVNAWPTVILIDPEGYAVWGTSGEITFEQVDRVIRAAMPHYRQKKLLDETPLRFDMELHAAVATPLRFPGKIIADEASGRLFISDSNHNRIVVAKLDGTLLEVIGSGAAGRKDGDFASAQFNQPQGLALGGDALFVADTENHEIRRVDLAARKVVTVAGTGQQAREPAVPGRPAGRPLAGRGTRPSAAPGIFSCTATISSLPWPAAIRFGGCGWMVRGLAPTPATDVRTSSTARYCPGRPMSRVLPRSHSPAA